MMTSGAAESTTTGEGQSRWPAKSASWTGNSTPAAAAAFLRAAKRIIVVTHARPDGDAVGSSAALVLTLRELGINASAWYIGPLPRWINEVTSGVPWKMIDANAAASGQLELEAQPDAVAVVDTGAWTQLEEVKLWLKGRGPQTLVIDHHLSGDPDVGDLRLIHPDAAAAAEIVALVCMELLGLKNPADLPKPIAQLLYLGCATDTGWFRFSNTRAQTLRLAAGLLEAGVDFTRLHAMVEQQDRPSRLRLLGRSMTGLELVADDRIAIMSLSQKDFEDCRGDAEDAGGFPNYALDVACVRVAAVLIEVAGRPAGAPITKVSLRSKPGQPTVDVAALTKDLGGGGHARAAGVKLAMPLAEARKFMTGKLAAALAAAPTA